MQTPAQLLIALMVLATLAVDAAWLGPRPPGDAHAWQTFMAWGGWAQWSGVVLWGVLGGSHPLARATAVTGVGMALAAGALTWAPAAAFAYIRLGLVHAAILAVVGLIGGRWARFRTGCVLAGDAARPSPRPRFRITLREWFGWTVLLAVWCAVAGDARLADFGGSPLVGVVNLAGAPAIALLAMNASGGCSRRAAQAVVAAACGIALAAGSTQWLDDGPWAAIAGRRLALSNVTQMLYLFAWGLLLEIAGRTHPSASSPASAG